MQPWRRALGAAGPFLRAARGAHGGAGERGRGAALAAGPDLRHFLAGAAPPPPGGPEQGPEPGPCVAAGPAPAPRKVYLETYGCQMNVNDTEIAWAILQKSGYTRTKALDEADVILLVTCSVREKAEQAIWNRLQHLKALKARRLQARLPLHIGILGCMAERLKEKILHREKLVDIVAGPDAYRDLPRLLTVAESGQQAANVLLSLEETYADILPVQTSAGGTTAFVSIMRGCDNMCSYCIVPFTRGRERSRPIASILQEVKMLSDQGVKEVTLLGQNVNSFRDLSEVQFQSAATPALSRGFSTVYKAKPGGLRFAHLLDQVSRTDPEMRIRFTSPHPKDFPDEVLQLIQERHNICKQLHLPAQSGSTRVLEAMRRGYTREAYLELVRHVRDSIPGVSLSSDFIAGFCGETEEDHQQTVSLLQEVRYNVGFLFAYSMRQKTRAYHRLQDDVPADVKQRRLEELITVFREEAARTNRAMVGHSQLVLVEGGFSHLASKNLGPNSKTAIREVTRLGILYGTGCKEPSKRSASELCGRNDGNIKVIFPDAEIEDAADCKALVRAQPGDYVLVKPEKLMSAEQVIPTNSAEFWSCKNLQHLENTTPITAVEGQHKETTQRTEDFDDFFQILITSPFANAWKGRHESPEFQGSLSPPQRFIPFYYRKLKCFYTSVPH